MLGRRLIDRFDEDAAACQSLASLRQVLDGATGELGFRHFALLHHASLDEAGRHLVRIESYPAGWVNEFQSAGLAAIDPVHRACARTNVGFTWNELPRLTTVTMRERDMLARARRFGVADGFTVPVNIPGEPAASCTFAIGPDETLPRDRLITAEQVATHAFATARRISGLTDLARGTRLSPREKQCVGLLAGGKTDQEIAHLLGISAQTVHDYVKHARAAYGATNRPQLVAWAVHDGLVTF